MQLTLFLEVNTRLTHMYQSEYHPSNYLRNII